MKKFKADLEKLLEKYPDIGGFTIHISPRVKIIEDSPAKPSLLPYLEPAKTSPRKEPATDPISSLESKITKSKLAELQRSSITE